MFRSRYNHSWTSNMIGEMTPDVWVVTENGNIMPLKLVFRPNTTRRTR